MEIVLAKKILKANDQMAQAIRARLESAQILCVNLLGSPGAGKTALLEALTPRLKTAARFTVIEGDLATCNDAERIERAGAPAVQINTEGGCHLDANMVTIALDTLDLKTMDLLFIENVGNLVCTAGFDLGETLRAVVLSVTEGDDKVVKYPPMFQSADAVIINKMDLLPFTDFSLDRLKENMRNIKPEALLFYTSARTGEGIEKLAEWLLSNIKKNK
ncbi:MAG: hydrogenase nickel incorporation protein HypB [Candidatus Sumerlaeota bacterium]|nr:hydrogenase nickel incorporation protein HypB [Candidatus Sumerlaeota bacterium]